MIFLDRLPLQVEDWRPRPVIVLGSKRQARRPQLPERFDLVLDNGNLLEVSGDPPQLILLSVDYARLDLRLLDAAAQAI